MPLVRPEKKASAIEQKKGLEDTSVNGTIIIEPPQVPVSARKALEAAVINKLTPASVINLFRLFFISQLRESGSITGAIEEHRVRAHKRA